MKCLLIPRKSFFEFFKALGQTQQIPFGVSPKFRYHPGELSWKSGVLGGILAPRAWNSLGNIRIGFNFIPFWWKLVCGPCYSNTLWLEILHWKTYQRAFLGHHMNRGPLCNLLRPSVYWCLHFSPCGVAFRSLRVSHLFGGLGKLLFPFLEGFNFWAHSSCGVPIFPIGHLCRLLKRGLRGLSP